MTPTLDRAALQRLIEQWRGQASESEMFDTPRAAIFTICADELASALSAAPGEQTTQTWQPCADGYEASTFGMIREVLTGRVLGQWPQSDGYMLVRLNNPRRLERVHRLVAAAFIPNEHQYPSVNHKDSNPQNNCPSNLEWCTQAQNLQHAASLGRMQRTYWKNKRSPNAQLTDDLVSRIRLDYDTQDCSHRELAERYGISKRTVGRIVNRQAYV